MANAAPFHSAYRRTFGDFEHLPAVAKCLYNNLPLDRTILFLFCPETGTAGYKPKKNHRSDTPTPELLVAAFTRAEPERQRATLTGRASHVRMAGTVDADAGATGSSKAPARHAHLSICVGRVRARHRHDAERSATARPRLERSRRMLVSKVSASTLVQAPG